ncbi:MAG: acyl-CoA dehydrogenase, partial [Pseudomonadota bacterium]
MDFAMTEAQRLLVETTRAFVARELAPHEERLEADGVLDRGLERALREKAKAVGLHACNLPERVGGGGLDAVSLALVEKELGRTSLALAECAHRPSNILAACAGEQIPAFLEPAVRGEARDCVAMTEPGAGSDLRGMRTRARRDGEDWVIDGEKHFISMAEFADVVILFAATGVERTPKGEKKRISTFLLRVDDPGVTVAPGYRSVSHRGYPNNVLRFEGARIPGWRLLGREGQGFELVNQWLGPTRLTVAATAVARAERAFELALEHAATREQFGQKIGKFQAVSFPLADMATEIRLANLLLMETAWRIDRAEADAAGGGGEGADDLGVACAMAKLYCTEMLGRVADQALQTFGGMGLMADLPLERIWRDARIERIWDGTSEIQRHI